MLHFKMYCFVVCVDVKRTTQGFDCKQAAAARTYLYMLPTFAFTPLTEVSTFECTGNITISSNNTVSFYITIIIQR